MKRRHLLTLLLLTASLTVAVFAALDPARAESARCLLEVGGKKYVDGICNFDPAPDGSFSINTGARRKSRFFAYVNKNDDGSAEGSWNGVHADSHAGDSLGVLRPEGSGCWINATSKVCAWR